MSTDDVIVFLDLEKSFINKIYLLDMGNSDSEFKKRFNNGEIDILELNPELNSSYEDFLDSCIYNEVNLIAELHIEKRFNLKLNSDNKIIGYSTNGTTNKIWLYGSEMKDIYNKALSEIEKMKASLSKIVDEVYNSNGSFISRDET